MPSRRGVLGALSAAVVAGCVGDTGGESSETRTPYYDGECNAVEPDWVDPERDSVEPKPLPDGPPAFDEGAIGSFVVAYEEAYLYNSVLQESTERVGASAWSPMVERVAGGFVVSLRSVYYYNVRDVTTDAGTATVLHADGPETTKAYLVTRQRLVRAEGEYDVTPDPRRRGETVECWDAA